MKKYIRRKMMMVSAATFIGMVSGVNTASAAAAGAAGGNSFNNILTNINSSISDLPGLISGMSYMMGVLLGVLGILKIKDHVENPGQTPLQQGAIRLAAGGALFALPIVYEAMQTTIGTGTTVVPSTVKTIQFNVVP